MKLLVTGAFSLDNNEKEKLERLGFDITFHKWENEAVDNPSQYECVICNNLFLHNNIEKFSSVRCIHLTSAGMKPELIEYTNDNGIKLFNAKDIYSIPIAEFVVMQALNMEKNTKSFISNQSKQIWKKDRSLTELYDKTALIVGYGSVGKEIVKRLKAFGVKIIVANRSKVEDNMFFDEYIQLDKINDYAQESDITIISIASCDETRNLIGNKYFENVKDGGTFINVSRGDVVDESELKIALSGKLRAAAIDVMENEPLDERSDLWDIDNLYITPHNSFVSDKVHKRLFNQIFDNILSFKER